MSTGVIRISAALFALALLIGVFAVNTQPTQAILEVDTSSEWASAPSARAYTYVYPMVTVVMEGTTAAPLTRYKRDTETRTIREATSGTPLTLVDSSIPYPRAGDPDPTSSSPGSYQYMSGVTEMQIADATALASGTAEETAAKAAAFDLIRLPAATDYGLVDMSEVPAEYEGLLGGGPHRPRRRHGWSDC